MPHVESSCKLQFEPPLPQHTAGLAALLLHLPGLLARPQAAPVYHAVQRVLRWRGMGQGGSNSRHSAHLRHRLECQAFSTQSKKRCFSSYSGLLQCSHLQPQSCTACTCTATGRARCRWPVSELCLVLPRLVAVALLHTASPALLWWETCFSSPPQTSARRRLGGGWGGGRCCSSRGPSRCACRPSCTWAARASCRRAGSGLEGGFPACPFLSSHCPWFISSSPRLPP